MQKIDGSHHEVKLSERDWRTVWLWIESAAPYAGSYAGLRNEAEMGLSGASLGALAQNGDVIGRRCLQCHGKGDLPTVPYGAPAWPDTRGITRPVARHERLVIENDPLARYSLHATVNLSRPEKSTLLLAPLAEEAGGWGTCGEVFVSADDRDYQVLLHALRAAKEARDAIPRYATPDWRPNGQYIREMKRYGVLSAAHDPTTTPIDPFEMDETYWRSLWHAGGS